MERTCGTEVRHLLMPGGLFGLYQFDESVRLVCLVLLYVLFLLYGSSLFTVTNGVDPYI